MKDHYTNKDVQTIRLLHEYGFTDGEVAEHLGIPPIVVRRIRHRLRLPARLSDKGITADRRRAREAVSLHPKQAHFGGQAAPVGVPALKLVDDRWFGNA